MSEPCLIIGEVAQAHDGNVEVAHRFIDAIADAGADAVKFQTHIAEAESTPDEPWRVRFSSVDASRYDYWKRTAFSLSQWQSLKEHATLRGLKFLSSPFSVEAIELLEQVGVDAWKVASGEVNNGPLLERLAKSRLPVYLSTGMNSWREIDAAIQQLQCRGLSVTLLQCTSAYPCPPEWIGLNVLDEFREKYHCAVGLSDHSGTIYPGLAASMLGIQVLEVHVTLSDKKTGPDGPASLTPAELKQLVEGVRFIEKMRESPVDKDAMLQTLAPLRKIFMKSIVAKTDLPAGTILQRNHLAIKKPGTGLAPNRIEDLIGCSLKRDVQADQLLTLEDVAVKNI